MARYDVPGIVNQIVGRFPKIEVMIRPSQTNSSSNEASAQYRAPAK